MRESLARSVNSSDLQDSNWRTTSLDKVHALGLANGLPAMIHFLDGLQADSYRTLIHTLSKHSNIKIPKREIGTLKRLCALAIQEAAFTFCQVCGGAKMMMAGQLKITCASCDGSGIRRHSDMDRAKFLGMDIADYQNRWAKRYQIISRTLADQYHLSTKSARHRLTSA